MCFHRWNPYFAFHLKMLRDIEEAQDQRVKVLPEPSTRPTSNWLEEEVSEIVKSVGLELTKTATKKARAELNSAILRAKDGSLQRNHELWTDTFVSVWHVVGSFLVGVLDDACIHRKKSSEPRPGKPSQRSKPGPSSLERPSRSAGHIGCSHRFRSTTFFFFQPFYSV